jgi:NADPH:quinone reductase-like Zn-dependent oxidoreductase
MVLRDVERHPLRLALSSLSVALAASIMLVGTTMVDSLDRAIDFQFTHVERQDLTVAFDRARSAEGLRELSHVPGVTLAEPSRVVLCVARGDLEDVTRRIEKISAVASFSEPALDRLQFQSQMSDALRAMTVLLAVFAGIISVGMVFNNARIALAVRSRDLATLRILGFTRGEVAVVLLGEQGLQLVIGVAASRRDPETASAPPIEGRHRIADGAALCSCPNQVHMKAYQLQPAAPGFDSLKQVDLPPAEVGPYDVRVRVRAVSLNYRDIVIAQLASRRAKPVVPTSDGAGEVVAVGSKVTRCAMGDRVAAAFFPTWFDGEFFEQAHENALGGSIDGMLREEVVLGERAWVKIPAHLSYEQAATLPCAGVTAYNALFEAATLRPGDTVLVQGSGGVSVFALQLARAAGATVLATSGSSEKRERLKELGAAATFDYRETPEWGAPVRKATAAGRGVDVVVEVGGPGTFDQSVAALRFGGTMSILGVLTGTSGSVNTHAIFHKNVRVQGVYVGSVVMFERLNRALAATRIVPIVDRTFPFDQARGAYEYLASARHFGKVVISLG